MAHHTNPRLPAELMLQVVEHSRDDVTALRQLALTSPDLHLQVASYLFDRVTLSSVYSYHRWIQFIENHPNTSIPHVNILIIESGRYDFSSDSSGQLWSNLAPHTLQRVLDLQPAEIPLPNPPINNINTLLWTPSQYPDAHSLPTVAHIVSSLECLDNLHVLKTPFTSVQQFQWFLSNCRPIRFLEIHRVMLNDGGEGQAQADLGINYDLTDLKELRVNSTFSMDWVVHRILSHSTPTGLTELSIESPSSLSGQAFGRLFGMVAPSLECLVIAANTVSRRDLPGVGAAASFPETMPRMQDLTVALPFLNVRPNEGGELVDWCFSFFEIFPAARSLSCITLLLDVGTVARLGQVINVLKDRWFRFLRLLFDRIPMSFPCVKEVVVHLVLNERPTEEEIQTMESLLRGSQDEITQIRVQWETTVDPGRYGQHLCDAISPMVALALRCRLEPFQSSQ